MKKCPSCGKEYDDSWEVCLQCEEPLKKSRKKSPKKEQEKEVTKNYLPKGLWVIIFLLGFDALNGLIQLVHKPVATLFNQVLEGNVAIGYNLVVIAIEIAIIYGLFFRKAFSRILLLFGCFFGITESVLLLFSSKETLVKVFIANAKPEALQTIEQGFDLYAQRGATVVYFVIFITCGAIAYYISRSKIKEYFN